MKNISHLIVLALFSFSVCLFSKLDAEEKVVFFEFTPFQDQEQCILLDHVQELCCQFPLHDISVCVCADFDDYAAILNEINLNDSPALIFRFNPGEEIEWCRLGYNFNEKKLVANSYFNNGINIIYCSAERDALMAEAQEHRKEALIELGKAIVESIGFGAAMASGHPVMGVLEGAASVDSFIKTAKKYNQYVELKREAERKEIENNESNENNLSKTDVDSWDRD